MPKPEVEFTLLKLGGSLITNKDVPDSVNKIALNHVAKAIKASGFPRKSEGLILVHGGGSFGHYYAHNAGLSRTRKSISSIGIAQTNNAMQRLHSFVISSLLARGVPTETILPSELLAKNRGELSATGITHMIDSFRDGLIPITLGYVLLSGLTASVISGDEICLAISNSLHVKRMIFAMDVDGIYPDSNLKGKRIENLSELSKIRTKSRRYDVTGGIKSKLDLGFKLYDKGVEVYYVNGMRPQRLMRLLIGREEAHATKITS